MQTNDLKALTIPEGNVLSVYSTGPGYPVNNYYPVANTFNPDDYEKETEVEIVSAKLKYNTANVGKTFTLTMFLTDGTVGSDGYAPLLYDTLSRVVLNSRFVWSSSKPSAANAFGRALYPKGERTLDVYVITPEQKIIGPTSFEATVK